MVIDLTINQDPQKTKGKKKTVTILAADPTP